MKSRPSPTKRFTWTPDLEADLRQIYQSARTRWELTQSLNVFQSRTGFTRVVILSRATELGLSFRQHRPWTEADVELLREHLGSLSTAAIARKLQRSYYSVKARVAKLNLSARVTDGYSQSDLQGLLGVSRNKIRCWVEKRWIPGASRISEASVTRFLREHPHEYCLRRVDEWWFKGVLFVAHAVRAEGRSATTRKQGPAAPEPILAEAESSGSVVIGQLSQGTP